MVQNTLDNQSSATVRPDMTVDIAVIGGGPAGATCSTVLAQSGLNVALFEREHFPRFHIGESLMPDTYWPLKRIGMLDKMKQSDFVKKCSVQFCNRNGKVSAPFYFTDHNPHECSQTWQVLRSEFDLMMLNNAREHGAKVFEGARVRDLICEGTGDSQRATGITILHDDGSTQTIHAKVVVDASGQSTLIATKFKTIDKDPDLKKGTVWTYFKGAYRDPGRDGGSTLVMQTADKEGWFWYIPLPDDVVSIGIVRPFDKLFAGNRDHETIFNEELENCAEAKRRVAMGTRCDVYRATKDFSYKSRKVSGDGWVLIGDAYSFLDPLYSSGVMLALKSGCDAGDCIIEGLKTGDLSAAQLGKWTSPYNAGVARMRRLIMEYYGGLSFGGFMKEHPHLRDKLTDMLIGDLFKDDVDELFAALDVCKLSM